MDKFILYLRQQKLGTIISTRDFIVKWVMSGLGIVPMTATLSARITRKNGTVDDRGIISVHAVTDAFVAQLVDSLQSSEATFSDYKYHDSGTGTNVEAAADTTLETPTGEARDVGSQIEGATANVYKSVATNTYAGSFAITEHGLFNLAAGGTLMDRSVFTALTVASGDQIEFTYQLTCTAGG